MQFLTSLFGGETNFVTVAIALAIVIVLIVLAVWLIKAIGDATRNVGRGRNRRLMVIDSIAIDNKRQAVIIRRDDVEHLIVIGGPNDFTVEAGFDAPEETYRAPRRRQATEPTPRPVQAAQQPKAPAPTPLQTAKPQSTSLRHTGLLRSGDSEPTLGVGTLGGGKSENAVRPVTDSAKNNPNSTTPRVEAEPVLEKRERDFADIGPNRT